MDMVPQARSRVRYPRLAALGCEQEKQGMKLSTVIGWIVVILLVLWVIHHPQQASTDVHNFGAALNSLVS